MQNALADGLRIIFIINALHILTTFFARFFHFANSVREAFPIFALSEEGRPTGKAPAEDGFYMIFFTGRRAGEERRRMVAARQQVNRQYKIKKGDRRLPKINYFCIAYVQAPNPRAKIRDLSGKTKG